VHADKDNRSLIKLLAELQQGTARLIQQEFALARAELSERAVQLAIGIGLIMSASIIMFVALLIVLMGLSELLAEFFPEALSLWLGYLIVGGVALLVGLLLLKRAIDNIRASGQLLARTADSIGRDVEMVKEHVR
jgi:hypothetical protein